MIVAFVATCIAPFPLSTADFDGASASDVSREYGAEAQNYAFHECGLRSCADHG